MKKAQAVKICRERYALLFLIIFVLYTRDEPWVDSR